MKLKEVFTKDKYRVIFCYPMIYRAFFNLKTVNFISFLLRGNVIYRKQEYRSVKLRLIGFDSIYLTVLTVLESVL